MPDPAAQTTETPRKEVAAYRPQITAGAAVNALIPRTIDEAWRLSEAFAKAAILPRGISGAPQVMLMICGGAELGLGPFQSLQSFYVVNNRLTIWGDAIPALLWSSGFKIKEYFEGQDPAYPDDMKAICEIARPDGEVIAREFSVADAKEGELWTKAGPWQTSKKRMLQMRARAFAARDGAPDVLRGLAIREEVEDYETTATGVPAPRGRKKADVVGQLKGPANDEPTPEDAEVIEHAREGFSHAHVTAETEGAGDGPAWPSSASYEGPAPRDTRYQLADDDLIDDAETCPVFVNGEEVGRLTVAEAAKVPEYEEHPAERPLTAEDVGRFDDTLGRVVTLADIAGTEAASAQEAGGDVGADAAEGDAAPGEAPAGSSEPSEEEEPEPGAFMAEIRSMESWLQIKARLTTLYKSDDWQALDPGDQDVVRAQVWTHVDELVKARKDPLDFVTDPTAFNLWICTQAGTDGADAIEGNFRILKREPAWGKMKPELQEKVATVVEARMAALRG